MWGARLRHAGYPVVVILFYIGYRHGFVDTNAFGLIGGLASALLWAMSSLLDPGTASNVKNIAIAGYLAAAMAAFSLGCLATPHSLSTFRPFEWTNLIWHTFKNNGIQFSFPPLLWEPNSHRGI